MRKVGLRIIVTLVAVLFTLPAAYVVVQSLLSEYGVGLAQYRMLFLGYPSYFEALKMSFCYAAVITMGGILISIPVAYLFAKVEFRGRNPLFFTYVVVMMLPVQSTILGQYLLMKSLNWVDQMQAIMLPLMLSPLTVFLLRQNMKQVPEELIEAAKLETSSVRMLLTKIVLPQVRGILGAAAVLLFCESWNIVEQAIILLPYNEDIKPLSVLMSRYPEEVLAAASTIYLAPIFILFLLLAIGTGGAVLKRKVSRVPD